MNQENRSTLLVITVTVIFVMAGTFVFPAEALTAQSKKPNILVIIGDDIGWFNIGPYHQGIMSGKTPNLD